MQRALILGSVGKDPEVKSKGDKKWATFPVATSRYDHSKKEKVTTWHAIKVFDQKLVETIERYVHKGTKIFVEGEIDISQYEKDGEKRTSISICLWPFSSQMELVANYGEQKQSQSSGSRDPDDDLPF